RVAQFTKFRNRRRLGRPAASGVAQHHLFFGQFGHVFALWFSYSGRLSTRLDSTLRLISDVPPSMELPLERSQDRVSKRASASKPGPSQPRPASPIASMLSSRRS